MTTLDTHAMVEDLQASGLPKPQAEAVVRAVVAGRDNLLEQLVTKSDFKLGLSELRSELLMWMFGAMGFQTLVVVGAILAGAAFLN